MPIGSLGDLYHMFQLPFRKHSSVLEGPSALGFQAEIGDRSSDAVRFMSPSGDRQGSTLIMFNVQRD